MSYENTEKELRGLVDHITSINDDFNGVKSHFDAANNKWIRDATNAAPQNPDHPVMTSNNMLLRSLSRLRPILYALDKSMAPEQFQQQQERLLKAFKSLSENAEILAAQNENKSSDEYKEIDKQFQAQQTEFNTLLYQTLLDTGLASPSDNPEKVMNQYRNLSSLLSPARTVETTTYDQENKLYHVHTQVPITQKTQTQKDEMAKLYSDPGIGGMSRANAIFKDLLQSDETVLPAQARKTHPHGVKNGYITKYEIQNQNRETLGMPFVFVQSGSPVYIGKGLNKDQNLAATVENLEQGKKAYNQFMQKHVKQAGNANLHFTCLNTPLGGLDKQDVIVDNILQATRGKTNGDTASICPVNALGRIASQDLSPDLFEPGQAPPDSFSRIQKNKNAAEALYTAWSKESCSWVACASGQDRTNTCVGQSISCNYVQSIYETHGMKYDETKAKSLWVNGGHGIHCTSELVSGSPGLKSDSMLGNFNDEQNKQLYRSSAKTNKHSHINEDQLNFDAYASTTSIKLKDTLRELQTAIRNCQSAPLKSACAEVSFEIQSQLAESGIERITPKTLNLLHNAAKVTLDTLNTPTSPHNLPNIESVIEQTPSTWGKFMKGLAAVGIAGLLVAGAVFSCGLAVPVYAAGAAALATIVGTSGLMADKDKQFKDSLKHLKEQIQQAAETPSHLKPVENSSKEPTPEITSRRSLG